MKKTISTISVSALIIVLVAAGVAWKYKEWFVIPKMRKPIAAYLKDPNSAQFRNEIVGKSGAICGEVNAKNSMGGYVGFKRYIAAGANGNYLEGDEPLDGWSEADIARRHEEEAKIFQLFVKYKKDFPGLEAPVGEELERLATKGFFDARWSDFCGPDNLSKT